MSPARKASSRGRWRFTESVSRCFDSLEIPQPRPGRSAIRRTLRVSRAMSTRLATSMSRRSTCSERTTYAPGSRGASSIWPVWRGSRTILEQHNRCTRRRSRFFTTSASAWKLLECSTSWFRALSLKEVGNARCGWQPQPPLFAARSVRGFRQRAWPGSRAAWWPREISQGPRPPPEPGWRGPHCRWTLSSRMREATASDVRLFRRRRIDQAADGGNAIRWKSRPPGMFENRGFVGCEVDAVHLVGRHVRVQPLNLRPDHPQSFNRRECGCADLVIGHIAGARYLSLNHELWHVRSYSIGGR